MTKVLYIDDEANAEKMLSKFEILQDYDIEITPVFSMSSILSTISQDLTKFNLIIVDLIMAPLDYFTLDETNRGLDTGKIIIKKIRENVSNTDIPIIIVSIRKKNSFEKYFLEKYKVNEFCVKPISALELKEVILRNIL